MRRFTYILSLFFMFIIPWENVVVLPQFGTISRVAGFVLIVFWLLSLFVVNRIHRPHKFHKTILILVFLQIISLTWSIDRELSLIRISTQIQLLLLSLLIWDMYTEKEMVFKALQAYVLGGFITIGSIISNYFQGVYATEQRITAEGFNLNDASFIIAIGIPLAWYLATQTNLRSGIVKWLNYSYLPIAVIAMVFTGGRAGLASVIPGLAFIFSTFRTLSYRRKALFLFAAVVLLLVSQSLIPQSTFDRLTIGTVDDLTNLDFNERRIIWADSIEEYKKSPIYGVGVGAGPSAIKASIHNTFIAMLLELGLPGVAVMLLFLLVLVQAVRQQPDQVLRSLWTNILLILLLANSLHSWQYRKQTWIILAFVITSRYLVAGVKRSIPDFSSRLQRKASPPLQNYRSQ